MHMTWRDEIEPMEALYIRSYADTVNTDPSLSLNPCWTARRDSMLAMTGSDVPRATVMTKTN